MSRVLLYRAGEARPCALVPWHVGMHIGPRDFGTMLVAPAPNIERLDQIRWLVSPAHDLRRPAMSYLISCNAGAEHWPFIPARQSCARRRGADSGGQGHGGRVSGPREGWQAAWRRCVPVHRRVALSGRLEGWAEERARHPLLCEWRPVRGRVGERLDARARRVHVEDRRQVHRRGACCAAQPQWARRG
jgi:hypothetical protein